MRLLYFAPIDPGLPQGHAVHLRRLTEAFEERGHEVCWLTLEARGDRPTPPRGGWIEVSKRGWPKLRHLSAELRLSRALARELERRRHDAVLVRLELLAFAPLVMRPRVPCLVESNSSLSTLGASTSFAGRLLAHAMEGAALRRADGVGVVTERLREIQIRNHRLEPSRVRVVVNGAVLPPLDRAVALDARRGLDASSGRFLVVFAGSLSRGQGLELLLDAMAGARSQELLLWIIGNGPERSRLEARARREPRVRFLGPRREAEVLTLLQSAELLVAPYDSALLHASGMEGLKILQGMACDRPVLASPGFLAPDLGRSLSVPQGLSAEAWSRALDKAVEEWKTAGAPTRDWPWPEGSSPGRAWIAEHRSWHRSAEAWERLFADVAR